MRTLLIGALVVAGLTGCGSDSSESAANLSPAAQEGRDAFLANGCSSCHGSDGGGGVGPPLVGLYQSEVRLEDGTTVVADRDYLVESILEPSAKIHEGYRLPMPQTELTDGELDAIVLFIQELGTETP